MFESKTIYHPRSLVLRESEDIVFAIDAGSPRWVGMDRAGIEILGRFDGRRSFGDVVRDHAAVSGREYGQAWQDVATIVGDAVRHKVLAEEPFANETYPGRESFLPVNSLRELWLHTNNSCNLTCGHCLVSSGPDGDPGLSADEWIAIIDDGCALGARRFYFTGGEPFIRRDVFRLIDAVLDRGDTELAILTNGIPLRGSVSDKLRSRDLSRLRLQISLDGSNGSINDPIRGKGSFPRIVEGIRSAVAIGVSVTVSTVVTRENIDDIADVTRLAARLGAKAQHLLWKHKRGRSIEDGSPSVEKVIAAVRAARAAGAEAGIVVDNCEAIKARLMAPSGTKRDLSGACVNSLCVYSDGKVYPSAALSDVPALCCGDARSGGLARILDSSAVVGRFRSQTVADRVPCRDCELRFFCGGGDIEHSWFYGGSIEALDPYCELHKAMFFDAMDSLTRDRRRYCLNGKSGNSSPVIFVGMGEGSVHCQAEEDFPAPRDVFGSAVLTTHSECVVSFDLDAPRKLVREFYSEAADTPQEDLCCPVKPNAEDLAHIPAEVVERFYGCGSPVADAAIRPGETTLDLGSGAGIDVFISARKTGPGGRSIGVDMTDAMLDHAREYKAIVAGNLGYDNTDFRKGYLEEIPAADASVDVVTSNCVINLSPDKLRVMAEIWRILRDHGRMVISDIVAESEVPPHHRKDPRLWGECISGALTQEELLAYMERAGFYGVRVLKKSFWKEVDGFRFHSVTVSGHKYEKKNGCRFSGETATYLGPFKGIADEEGHWFPRNVAVEVCTDTAAKLAYPPYKGMFQLAGDSHENVSCYGSDTGSKCC